MANKTPLNRKYTYLREYTREMPRFVTEYLIEYYDGESINTQVGYAIDIRIFLNYLIQTAFPELKDIKHIRVSHINKVNVSDLISFRNYLKEYEAVTVSPSGKPITRVYRNSPFGINRKMSAVRGLFVYLYKTEQIDQNVTDKVDFLKLHQKIKKPLTTQETLALIDVIYNGEKYYEGRFLTEYQKRKLRDIAIFTTYLGTGIRVSELVNLKINDIDFETQSFIVTRKGGDQQEIFMPVQVENQICEYIESTKDIRPSGNSPLFLSRTLGAMTAAGIEKLLRNYCLTAGITHPDKTRPHALRRTFACRLLEDGVDIKMVAELMGHKNIEVTHRYYAQYSQKARKEIMTNLNVFDEGSITK